MSADLGRIASRRRLPILAYHSISSGPPPLCLPVSRFREHMESLHGAGWRTLTLDELLDGHARGGWPDRSVVLTFDDGLASVMTHAVPTLTRFGFTAMAFVVAGRIGASADWRGWPRGTPAERLLDSQGLRDAAAAGVEIGAHAVTHARLSMLPADAAAREVLESRAMIEDVIGRAVRCFAYPFGDAPDTAARLVRDHFAAGFGIRLAFASPASRIEVLERIDAHYLRRRSSLTRLHHATTRAWLSGRAVVRGARRALGDRIRLLQPNPVDRDA